MNFKSIVWFIKAILLLLLFLLIQTFHEKNREQGTPQVRRVEDAPYQLFPANKIQIFITRLKLIAGQ